MLGYFPVPYKDELLYSLIARYALHMGLSDNQKAVVREVFTSSTAVAVPDMPSHLNALAQNLKFVWPISVSEFIGSYTLAPIYLPFLTQTQARKIVHSMRSESGGNIHTRAGIAASSVKQQENFRYCPECIKEQQAELGECYWQRAHQLPGVEFCVSHSCSLKYSTVQFHPKEKHLFVSATASQLDTSRRQIELSDIEKTLHNRYVELLQASQLEGFGLNRWTLFYRNLAFELGLVNRSRVKHKEILLLLKKAWAGTEFEGQFQIVGDHYWLKHLFRKHRKSFHPLRHLLVTVALAPEWTVQQILEKVRGLPDRPRKPAVTSNTAVVTRREINEHRKSWKNLVDQYPSVGVKVLRSTKCGGAIYAWLYRNDKQWLMSNRPCKILANNGHYTADYQKWDDDNVALLEHIYFEMTSVSNRQRLTRTRFIKALPRSNSVEKYLSKMPKTAHWITEHEESVEDYQLYRLNAAYEQIKSGNLEVKRWRLLRFASIRKELITPKIEAAIKELEQRT
ncbi:MAG: TnsD family Tn7-like transposition protein [Neptuniibacter sp.]